MTMLTEQHGPLFDLIEQMKEAHAKCPPVEDPPVDDWAANDCCARCRSDICCGASSEFKMEVPNEMKNTSYDEKALEWAERMRSGGNHAHSYLEKPAMYAKLPHLKGKTVLCIGCGSGEECEHLLQCGAKRVVGIDTSKELISIANESYPDIEFRVEDMRKMKFPQASFDFVYSSLAMHYLSNWQSTLKKIYRVLKPRGTFLFSTHHPACWSAEIVRAKHDWARLLGYETIGGRVKRIYGDYHNRHQIHDVWFGDMAVSYYHKPLSEIFDEIRRAGFVVVDFLEPKPRPLLKKINPGEYLLYSRIPLFMICELKRAKYPKTQCSPQN